MFLLTMIKSNLPSREDESKIVTKTLEQFVKTEISKDAL